MSEKSIITIGGTLFGVALLFINPPIPFVVTLAIAAGGLTYLTRNL